MAARSGPSRLPAPGLGVRPRQRRRPSCPRARDLPGRPRPAAEAPGACLSLVTAVSVYTNGTVFATDTDVTFVAVTEETGPLEFTWYFGEDAPVRTPSRSVRRRLAVPGWCVRGDVTAGIAARALWRERAATACLRVALALCPLARLRVAHGRGVKESGLPPWGRAGGCALGPEGPGFGRPAATTAAEANSSSEDGSRGSPRRLERCIR